MPGRFHHLTTHAPPSWSHKWRAIRTGLLLPYKPEEHDVARLPAATPGAPPEAKPGEIVVTWVGHASFLVQAGGLRILTDPVWSSRLPGRLGRLQPPGIPWDALGRIDAVVLSHNHYDHMDKRTLVRLGRSTHMFVPLGTQKWFTENGFRNVHALGWWRTLKVAGTRFQFVPAHHWSRRHLTDKNDSLWGGWVITPPGRNGIYFAGDTAYGPAFEAIARVHHDLEVAMLPIGAYTPRWHEHGVHMNPEEAVQAFRDLGARTMVPMHWGTFPLAPEPVKEPHDRLLRAWEDSGLDWARLADLPVGGTHVEAMPEAHELPPVVQARLHARPRAKAFHRLLQRVVHKLGPAAQ